MSLTVPSIQIRLHCAFRIILYRIKIRVSQAKVHCLNKSTVAILWRVVKTAHFLGPVDRAQKGRL